MTFAELKPRAGLFEHRVVLGATVDAPGAQWRVFVTHLTNGDPEVNRGQVDSLIAFVESNTEGPAIIAGDFNAGEDSPQIQTMSRYALDVWRDAQPQPRANTCCVDDLTSDSSAGLDERIDYIFLLAPTEYGLSTPTCERILDQPFSTSTGWLRLSDHAGLFVTVPAAGLPR